MSRFSVFSFRRRIQHILRYLARQARPAVSGCLHGIKGVVHRIRKHESGKPGFPQKRIFSINTSSVILWFLLYSSLFLIIHSILHENEISHPLFSFLLEFKLSDINTSSALFSAVLALIAVNRQQQLMHRPIINFKPRAFPPTPIQEDSDLHDDFRYECYVVNQGLGMCIFEKIEYLVDFWPYRRIEPAIVEPLEYDKLMELLASLDLIPEKDFMMLNMRRGSCLQTGGGYKCLEAHKKFVLTVRRLRLNLYFKSLLGERYYKEIDVIPDKGIMALRFSSLFQALKSGAGESLP